MNPNPSSIFNHGERFLAHFKLDLFSAYQHNNLYYPFALLNDWEMANFLLKSRLSMNLIDKVLLLQMVRQMPLLFQTAKDLHAWAELLPSGSQWKFKVVPTTHPTKQPIHLYYWDAHKCIELLVYTEWMSSDSAWEMQSQIPAGGTLCSVILSSNKTHIMNIAGGRIAHSLLISLANIKMSVRNKGSSHAFLLLALLPIAQFTHPKKRIWGVLNASAMIDCMHSLTSHVTMATYKNYGDAQCHEPCTTDITLSQLASIDCDPLLVEEYFAACMQFQLSEFWNHDVWWCIQGLEDTAIDFQFSIIPPITGLCQFPTGITKLKQICDIVIAIHALMEFHYMAQAPALTSASCDQIKATLQEFHHHKNAIIESGLCRWSTTGAILEHWQIPKLKLFQSVTSSIEQVGSLLQWSADTTEHANIEVVKDSSSITNNQNYNNRDERCHLINTAIALSMISSQPNDLGKTSDKEEDDDHGYNEVGNALSNIWTPQCKQTNCFAIGTQLLASVTSGSRPLRTFSIGSTVFHLNYNPSLCCVPINNVATPDLHVALANYIKHEGEFVQNFHKFDPRRSAEELQVWYKVCLQQKCYNPSVVAPMLTIHACPPNHSSKHGSLQGTYLLVYAQCFNIVPQGNNGVECTTGLHVLKQATQRISGVTLTLGDILPLDQLRSYAHIVPQFGRVADNHITFSNYTEYSESIYLNKYFDKDFFYAIM
ncbi:hypothetical protein V8E55_001072 [Tylopilus felleus]